MSVPVSQFTPPSPFPPVTISLFPTSVTLFLSCRKVHLYHFFNFTYKWQHMIFVFLLSLSQKKE